MKAAAFEAITSQNNSCCPKLSLKTRIIGFFITFFLGIILIIMSFGSIFGVLAGGSSFVIFFTLGNITTLCS